jgi:hypothetical protein
MMQWLKQKNETAKAYAAFQVYLELGKERTIDSAHTQATGHQNTVKRSSRAWLRWSSKYNWVARANAYDEHLIILQMQHAEEETKRKATATLARREKLLQAELELAARLLDRARKILEKDLKNCSYSDAARMVETADKILRLSADMATEKVTLEVNKMTDAKIDHFLELLERKLDEHTYLNVLEALSEKSLN